MTPPLSLAARATYERLDLSHRANRGHHGNSVFSWIAPAEAARILLTTSSHSGVDPADRAARRSESGSLFSGTKSISTVDDLIGQRNELDEGTHRPHVRRPGLQEKRRLG
jgi:hypothetical protein